MDGTAKTLKKKKGEPMSRIPKQEDAHKPPKIPQRKDSSEKTSSARSDLSKIQQNAGRSKTHTQKQVSAAAGMLLGGILAGLALAGFLMMSHGFNNETENLISQQAPLTKEQEENREMSNQSAEVLNAAREIHDALKAYGMPNVQIAGILGNFQAESGLDAGCVEGIYSERFQKYGPIRQRALQDLSSFTQNDLFGMYDQQGITYHAPSYQGSDGQYYCGVGLLQWTGPGAKQMLDTAKAAGQDWDNLHFQLCYLLADIYRPGGMDTYKNMEFATPEEAAYWFRINIEGNSVYGIEESKAFAKSWMRFMDKWDRNPSSSSSILNSVSGLADKAMMASEETETAESGSEKEMDSHSETSSFSQDTLDPSDVPNESS